MIKLFATTAFLLSIRWGGILAESRVLRGGGRGYKKDKGKNKDKKKGKNKGIPPFWFVNKIEDFVQINGLPEREGPLCYPNPPVPPLCIGDNIIQVTDTFKESTLETKIGNFWSRCTVMQLPPAGWLQCQFTWSFDAGAFDDEEEFFTVEESGIYKFGDDERSAFFSNPITGGTGRFSQTGGLCNVTRVEGQGTGITFFDSKMRVDMDPQ